MLVVSKSQKGPEISEGQGNQKQTEDLENQAIIAKLQGMTERERMEFYLKMFLDFIENGEYEEAYALLYPQFKEDYFSTLEEFVGYVQKTFSDFAALDKIACYMAVTLVKVGHGLCKPSVGSYFLFVFCSMDIHNAGCLERSLNVIGFEVEPVGRWLILEQVIFATTVVENHIHNDFQTFTVCLFYQAFKCFIAAQTAVYLIIVGNGIAMI